MMMIRADNDDDDDDDDDDYDDWEPCASILGGVGRGLDTVRWIL